MLKIATTSVALFAVLFVIVILFAPIALIWSLNELFFLGIDYNFYTWLAACVLIIFFNSSAIKS
jgi:hypothetical protein